jgi:hypothetical protein
MGISAALQAAIGGYLKDGNVRGWLEGVAGSGITAQRPVDAPVGDWGLTPEMHRLLDAAERVDTVGAFFVEIGSGGWASLGVLWRLGLVSALAEDLDEELLFTDEIEFTEEEDIPVSVPDEPSTTATDTTETFRIPRTASKKSASSGGRADRTSTKRKKRRRDPRVVAILRTPYESP